MNLKSLPLLTLLLTVSLSLPFCLCDLSAAVGGRKAAVLGGWRRIDDLKAADVQEVAKFAVSEHNKLTDSNLIYKKVVRGDTQVVSGMNYRLVISARDDGVSGKYEATVWVKPWEHYMNLTAFNKL